MLYKVIQEKRETILKLAEENGIQDIRVFGSVSRKEEGPDSDLDLLVKFSEGRSLFDLIRFKQDIEDILQTKVDVVTENSIHHSIKDKVINGAIQL
jgi:uncharacterized protein